MTFWDIESQYSANTGLDSIMEVQAQFFSQFEDVISPGDLYVLLTAQLRSAHTSRVGCSIQLASAVGISNCPGAPRLEFLLGRPNATAPAPDYTSPGPSDSTDVILARFADAGFSSDEVVALLASLVCSL
jgi:manganese peroxidase